MYFDFSSYFYYVVNSFGYNKILRYLSYCSLLLIYQNTIYYLLLLNIYLYDVIMFIINTVITKLSC